MLDGVEVSRSWMKRMKSTGKRTEPWGTPALMECRLESLFLGGEHQNMSPLDSIAMSSG